MTEPNGHVCPECGAHRGRTTPRPAAAPAGRPTPARHPYGDRRAAEDFDPLRIRPYVELRAEYSGYSGEDQGRGVSAGARRPGRNGGGAPARGLEDRRAFGHRRWAGAGSWTPEGASMPMSRHGAPPNGTAPIDGAGPAGVQGTPAPHRRTAATRGPRRRTGQCVSHRRAAFRRPAGRRCRRRTATTPPPTMQLAAIPRTRRCGWPPYPLRRPCHRAAVHPDATMRLKALPSEARATDVRLFQERPRSPDGGLRRGPAGAPPTDGGRSPSPGPW